MKEKNNYDGESQPLTEPDKTQIIESGELSDKTSEKVKSPGINYKLPPKQQINFNFDLKNKKNKLTEKELEILEINKEYIESKLWYWKLDDYFKFDLPPTIFKEKKVIDIKEGFKYINTGIKYANPSIIGKHFSKNILSQIWLNGEFNIQSTIPDFPYIWHITECMIKGYEKVKLSYFSILSAAFMFLYTLKYRFYSENYKEFCGFSFVSVFYHLYNSFLRIIDLFFGIPNYINNKHQTQKEIIQKRISNFVNEHSDFDFDFFNDETKNELKAFEEKFETKWVEEINPSLLSQYKNMNKQEMTNILKNKKLEEYLKFLKNDSHFLIFEKSHPSTKDYLISQQVINDKSFYNNLEKDNKLNNFEKELKKNYVRYLCDFWKDENMNSYRDKLEKQTIEKIQKEIKREIKDKKDPIAIYTFNTTNQNELQELIKKYSKRNKIPKVKYNIPKNLCCYNKVEYLDSRGNVNYRLEKETNHEMTSTFFFWRLILFIFKYFFDLWNFNVFFGKIIVNSMFGIKALCFLELYRDYDINPSTGEKFDIDKTVTFPGSLRNLWIMVQESRKNFENAPDTGILGKGCMRIFHLFYNYVLILFFLVLLLTIFYPLIIFATIILCLFLIILSPILIMIWIVLDYLFTLIIYNRFDEDLNIMPIFYVFVIELAFGFFFQLISIFVLIVFQPILSLFVFIFAQIYFFFRILLNCFFISIIACFGRVPQSDSCVAWQTSGPGLFIERYYDISNQDIIYLVIGYLENIILEEFRKNMEKMLESPKTQIVEINQIFGMLGFDFVLTEEFDDSIEFYKQKLNSQIKKYNKYPICNVNVKFTEERLQDIKYMITLYVSEYSKSHDISHEINKYKKLDLFVEEILKTIFDYNILSPLENSEKLTHLKSVFENEIDVIAKKIFENPYFQDKIIVEENIDDKNNPIKGDLKSPTTATFEQVFKGDLNLNFSPLSEREKEHILSKSENIINIKFQY